VAITFPRALPSIRFGWCRFELKDPVKASPSGAGLINYTRIGDPAWTIRFTTVPLRESELATLSAWVVSLRQGLKSALVQQNVTCRPLAHSDPANAAPAQTAGTLASVTNGNVLAVTGVASGLVLGAGDLVGLERSGKYGLCRVTDVSGTGTTRTITVEPPPRSYVAQAGTTVRFENPKLVMRLAPDSWSLADGYMPVASFQMVESPS
jgi:hypothetical protein